MEVYNQNQGYNSQNQVKTNQGAVSFAKIFGYMAIGILITGAVAIALSFGLKNVDIRTISGLSIAFSIVQVIISVVMTFVVLKGSKSVVGYGILYSITVGLLFGTLFALIVKNLGQSQGYGVIGMAFGITAGTFLLMSLIATLSKGNLSGLGIMGIGLFAGAGMICLVNLIIGLFNKSAFMTLYWVTDFIIFAAIMLITIYDIWNIKKITESGFHSDSLEFFCAFSMYNDFIAIFIRILYYLVILFGNNRR